MATHDNCKFNCGGTGCSAKENPSNLTPYQDALTLLNRYDGQRFEAAKAMLYKMSDSDLELITDECLGIQRARRRTEKAKRINEAARRS